MKVNGIPDHDIIAVWNKKYPDKVVNSIKQLDEYDRTEMSNLIRQHEVVTISLDGNIIARTNLRALVALVLSAKSELRKEMAEMEATTVGSILADPNKTGSKTIQPWKLQDFADNYDYLERAFNAAESLTKATKVATDATRTSDFYIKRR